MYVYTDAELLPVARQIFGELKYGLGNPPKRDLIETLVRDLAVEWTLRTYASFAESFPGQDPELARQAGQYLRDHFDALWLENPQVEIWEEDKKRFGFQG